MHLKSVKIKYCLPQWQIRCSLVNKEQNKQKQDLIYTEPLLVCWHIAAALPLLILRCNTMPESSIGLHIISQRQRQSHATRGRVKNHKTLKIFFTYTAVCTLHLSDLSEGSIKAYLKPVTSYHLLSTCVPATILSRLPKHLSSLSQKSHKTGTIIVPSLQMRKLRLTSVKGIMLIDGRAAI